MDNKFVIKKIHTKDAWYGSKRELVGEVIVANFVRNNRDIRGYKICSGRIDSGYWEDADIYFFAVKLEPTE